MSVIRQGTVTSGVNRIVTSFTSSGTFTPPVGTSSTNPLICDVTIVGGGGGGAGANTVGGISGMGGNAGQRLTLTGVRVTGTVSVTVGAAGTAGAASTAGGNGGASAFGALGSAAGGLAGAVLSAATPPATTGMGATSAGGKAGLATMFVASNSAGTTTPIAVSFDGITWTSRTGLSSAWYPDHLAYINGTFIGVSANTYNIYNAPLDAVTWTQQTAYRLTSYLGAVTGGPRLIIFDGANAVSTTDGALWAPPKALPSSASFSWKAGYYGGGQYVLMAGGAGSTVGATSPDGFTWTTRTLPAANWWAGAYGVVTGGGMHVLTSLSTVAASSPDGITWTARTLPSSKSWVSVAYGNGLFVTTNNSDGGYAISSDGINWTARTMPTATGTGYYVTYADGTWVAVPNVAGFNAASSTDGLNWTNRTIPSANYNWVTARPTVAPGAPTLASLTGATPSGGAAGNFAASGNGGTGGDFIPPASQTGTASTPATAGRTFGAGGGGGGAGSTAGGAGGAGLVSVSYTVRPS